MGFSGNASTRNVGSRMFVVFSRRVCIRHVVSRMIGRVSSPGPKGGHGRSCFRGGRPGCRLNAWVMC